MPLKLGAASVTLKLGSQSVTGRLGVTLVTATVPGAPTITRAWDGAPILWTAPDDGGSALTAYRLYQDDELVESSGWDTQSADAYNIGEVIEVSAVNAAGEGPRSAPVAVIAEP